MLSMVVILILFLSTLSLRRATRILHQFPSQSPISIHALLAESDAAAGRFCYLDNIISIHALLAESDAGIVTSQAIFGVFLSTLSLRRATRNGRIWIMTTEISIHALLAESDVADLGPIPDVAYFYPRSPCGERLLLARHFCGRR